MPNYESKGNCWKDNEHEYDYHDKHHHDKKEECCCKESMKEALELLSNATLKSYINFNEFAFIGHKFLIGTNLEAAGDPLDIDNIASPSAQFKGLDSCNCDLIKLGTSNVYYPIPNSDPTVAQLDAFTVNYASLCDIEAIAFNLTADTDKDVFEANLTALLDEYNKKCKVKCDECCCNDGIFNAVYSPFSPNNLVGLTAGWLAVADAKVLGRVANVLVLSSNTENIIYFVCLDSVGFINY